MHILFLQSFCSNFVFVNIHTTQLLSDIIKISVILKTNISSYQYNCLEKLLASRLCGSYFDSHIGCHFISWQCPGYLQVCISHFNIHLPFVLINVKISSLISRDFLMPQDYICTTKSLSYLL